MSKPIFFRKKSSFITSRSSFYKSWMSWYTKLLKKLNQKFKYWFLECVYIENKMITLYYDIGNASCVQAIKWFRKHNINIKKKRIELITKNAVVYILSLTNNGFLDILKYTTRLSLKKLDQIKHIETSTFNTSVNYILENTNILRSPLIVDQNKLLIGYKAEDIIIFLPPKYREVEIS